MSNSISVRATLNQVLTILHVENESQRERMIDEVEQVIQTKVMLLSLEEIPQEKRQAIAKLSPGEIKELLRRHISEDVIKKTLERATEDIVPGYIAELAQGAPQKEQEEIQELLAASVSR